MKNRMYLTAAEAKEVKPLSLERYNALVDAVRTLRGTGWTEWTPGSDKSGTGKIGQWSLGGWYWFEAELAASVAKEAR